MVLWNNINRLMNSVIGVGNIDIMEVSVVLVMTQGSDMRHS